MAKEFNDGLTSVFSVGTVMELYFLQGEPNIWVEKSSIHLCTGSWCHLDAILLSTANICQTNKNLIRQN